MLEIKNVCKNFGGIKAVNNCSFEIENKLITALIGPNGSGKSTLFNLISGITEKDSGDIFFKNINITRFSPENISNIGISRLFQKAQLFDNLTVEENLLLAFDNEDTKFWKNIFLGAKVNKNKSKKVAEMLEIIELEKLRHEFGKNLSYGQKRLVEIARAILNPHELLILDEPVAGVNPRLRTKIFKLLKNLKENGETILIIEHDMDFVLKLADNVVVMDEGKVIAQGSPSEIKKNKEVLEAYLGD